MGAIENAKAYGLTLRESANDGSDFTNPDADYRRFWLGEDGLLHLKDSAGGVTTLQTYSGPTWTTGTSMPGSPTTNDRITRTDLGLDFYYDGTRWLSTTLYREPLKITTTSFSTSPIAWGRWTPWHTTYDLWLDAWYTSTYVATTNDGTKYWTVTLIKYQSNFGTQSTIDSFTTASDAADTLVTRRRAIGALLTPGTYPLISGAVVKTSTPGDIDPYMALTYRLVGT